MNESEKTHKIRSAEFIEKYFQGNIIDIGAGNAPVISDAEIFDLKDGDANVLSRYKTKNTYDLVHSSHCLEHMVDAKSALNEWWSLLKSGGYMILVVPDHDLYEQKIWPSIFNKDHKHSFTITSQKNFSSAPINLVSLLKSIPDLKIISQEIQDHGYCYNLQNLNPNPRLNPPKVFKILKELLRLMPKLNKILIFQLENYLFHKYGIPIDQTKRDALAQIQIVAQKVSILEV
jgi:SAM-dependent methyltransferase